MSARSDGKDKPTITGTTNLPDGIKILLTLGRKISLYAAQDKATISGGKFRFGPFGQGEKPLNPGTYSVEVTMAIADVQPPNTWPVIGNEGAKLTGPLVQNSGFGGRFVTYKTTIQIGDGKSFTEGDRLARNQVKKDMHEWWLRSCKDGCNLSRTVAIKKGESFDGERCYFRCVANEEK